MPYLTCLDLAQEDRWPAGRSQPWWHISSFLSEPSRHSRISSAGARVLLGATRRADGLLTLSLAEQPLHEDGATSLAGGMHQWPNLLHLNLDNTSIGDRGAQALLPHLRTTLTVLSLTHNNIRRDGFNALAARIPRLSLVHLDISSNHSSMNNERTVTDMSLAIADCPTLTWLDLSSTGLRDPGATHLAQGLMNSGMRSLFTGYNDLSGEGIRQMARIASLVTTLTTLSISNTSDNGDGAIWWGTWLGPEPIALRTLDWSCVSITPQGATDPGGLFGALRSCPLLTSLDLTRCELDPPSAAALATALRGCPYLTEVDWEANDIGLHCASRVARFHPHLHTLSLNFCSIGTAGAVNLAKALQYCPTLHTLQLEHNGIGDVGISRLLRFGGSQLRSLSLAANKISSQGIQKFALHAQPLLSLTHLDLSDNSIGDHGLHYLFTSSRGWPALTHLSLESVHLGQHGGTILVQALTLIPTLRQLDLDSNFIRQPEWTTLSAFSCKVTGLNRHRFPFPTYEHILSTR